MSSYTREQLEAWIKTKSVSGKVLDIGGSQKPVFGRIKSDGETEFFILDLETPHEVDLAPQIIWDMNQPLDDSFPRKDLFGSFDFAVCLEVSEYWWDPMTALRNINKFLKRGGKAFLSFHFIYPQHNPVEYDMVRYTPKGAVKMVKEAGFLVAEETPRELYLKDDRTLQHFFTEERMRPARGIKHTQVGSLLEVIKR